MLMVFMPHGWLFARRFIVKPNKNKIWKLAEMDADHVTAWSKGGATDPANCEMLCKTHNKSKGNR